MAIENLQLQVITNKTDHSNIIIGNSKFTDDIWDLSDFIPNKTLDITYKRCDFTFIKNERMKHTIKLYAYYKLGTCKPQTVRDTVRYFAPFILFAEATNVEDFIEVTSEIFLKFSQWLKDEYSSKVRDNTQKRLGKTTGYIYCNVVEDLIKVGQIKKWNVTNQMFFKEFNSYMLWNPPKNAQKKKHKPIPENILNKILYLALNKETDIYTKASIIIQSQTGLRISEVLSIKKGCIKSTNDGVNYLEVSVSKTEKGQPIVHKIFCNDLVVNAVKELEDATNDLRLRSNLQELFIHKPRNSKKVRIYVSGSWSTNKLKPFIERWDIRDNNNNLYNLNSHQFRATYVRELIKHKMPIAYIMKHFNHVSVEMTAHYLTLQEEEVKEIYTDMILRPESKIAGLRSDEIKKTLFEQFRGKTEDEIDDIISNLSTSMSFNPLPTGVCLYDFRRGNCSDGDGCFFYNCPNYITEVKFYPILKQELDLMEREMARFKELGRERDWQRQYVKYKYLKPLVDSLEVQMNDQEA